MISKSGQPVLLDFGLARDDSEDAGPSLTQTGDLFGTPAYMSPEQITGRRVRLDRRSDIYSLGVTLYECLTLKRPFEAPTRESLYQAILSKEAQPARRLNRQIPADLEVVLQCAMDKDRDKRYQTAADFAEDLRRVRSGEPILAKKVSLVGRVWRWSKRRPAAAALLAVLFLGIPTISGLGVWYWTHLDDVQAQERAKILEAVEDQLEIGFYELHHGDPETALAAFEEALAIDADTPEAVAGLALSHKKLGKLEAALQVLEHAEREITSPESLIPVKADVLRSLGKVALADALLSDAPKVEGALAWFIAGTRAMDRGHALGEKTPGGTAAFTEAEGHLHRAVLASLRPRRAYHFELAHARGHCESEKAVVAADAVAALWPQFAAAWYWSGFATAGVDPQRSVAAFREAIRLKPDYVDAHGELGYSLLGQGKLDEAIAAYREAIRLKPGHSVLLTNLGGALFRQGKPDEAIDAYREAIRLRPDDAEVHNNLGSALVHQGKLDEAVAAFREAVRLAPADHRFQRARDWVLGQMASAEDRIAKLREAVERDPENPSLLNELAWMLVDPAGDASVRDPKEALPLARKAVEVSGRRDAGILDTLAVALAANSELKEAVAVQEEILELMNGKDVPGMTVADAEAALDRYRKALTAQDKEGRLPQ
jgi:tetratricopeptide (TPR) repeat protein